MIVIKRSQLGSCVVFFFVPTVSGREIHSLNNVVIVTKHKRRGLIHLGVLYLRHRLGVKILVINSSTTIFIFITPISINQTMF